jgi:hypothetical protein
MPVYRPPIGEAIWYQKPAVATLRVLNLPAMAESRSCQLSQVPICVDLNRFCRCRYGWPQTGAIARRIVDSSLQRFLIVWHF